MPTWIFYALLAAFFAGLTSVLAKYGIGKINSDLGLAIRTITVFVFVCINLFFLKGFADIKNLDKKSILFLILSGCTTALSWIFYYRAMKIGTVSYVAAIDKSSIVITLLVSYFLLKEPMTPKLLLGAGLIFSGMIVLIWK